MWTAARYTSPRIKKAGQALVAEDGSIAESQEEKEQAIMAAHFPRAPRGSFEPGEGGKAFEGVNAHLVGTLLAKASSTLGRGRRLHIGRHCQILLAMGEGADRAAGLSVHPTWLPSEAVEDNEGGGHTETGETGLLKSLCVQGDLAPGRHQQTGRTHGRPPDC